VNAADERELEQRAVQAPRPVAYLFTTFPVASETFLRREVAAMRSLGVDLRAWSLWGGAADVDGLPVRRVRTWRAAALLWRLPWAVSRRPEAFVELAGEMLERPVPSTLNFLENLWGAACAVLIETQVRRSGAARLHAVWSSMPATAAWLLGRLTGLPYSLGAHAYDVFEDGGDWLLPLKLRDATRVHTTTGAARARLLALGCDPERLALVRRGLSTLQPMRPPRTPRTPLRLLSVGRLVEKKGYPDLLALCAHLRDTGFPFELRIVGGGPMEHALRALVQRLDIGDCVRLPGQVDPAAVVEQLAWADVFVFSGRIARNGDRDGFPNVVGEAMAAGVPVLSTPVGGVPEVIRDGVNGLLASLDASRPETFAAWRASLLRLRDDDAFTRRLTQAARAWAEQEFDAKRNAGKLLAAMEEGTKVQRSQGT